MKEKRQPKVSILVPMYNVEKLLPRCLDSIVGQTMKEIEIVVVNDASPDGSLAIARRYAERDDRFVIIDKPVNEGLMMARRTAIEAASAPRVFFLDSDDYIPADAIERLYREAWRSEADIVVGNMYLENLKGRHVLRPRAHVAGKDGDAYMRAILSWTTCSLCGSLFNRKILLHPGLPAMKGRVHSEDRILLTALLLQTKPKVATADVDAYYYCLNTESATRRRLTDDNLRSQLEALTYCYDYVEKNSGNYTALNDNYLLRYLSLYLEKGYPREIVGDYNDTTRRLLEFDTMVKTTSLRFAIHTRLSLVSPLYRRLATAGRSTIRKIQGKD
ncbi:MAG: glycosyltransferase family 2 protein [Muribaculaceae bacterium]|nr:glycosyltransferase family 2 protein [Muribaculaceae bacterium]